MIRIGQEYEHVWGDNYSFWNHVTCEWEENPTTHVGEWKIRDFGDEAFWHQTISSMLEDRIWQK